MSLTDTITRDGSACEVRLIREQCDKLGPKQFSRDGSPLMAKAQGCRNTPENIRPIIFTPVYACSLFRLAAPFASEIEDELEPARPCGDCGKYIRLQSGNGLDQTPTIED